MNRPAELRRLLASVESQSVLPDEVIVVDRGRVVQRGPHVELLRDADSVYARLYASWLEQTRN